MGLFVSKPDPLFVVSQKRSHISDDGQSKATATTEDSSVMQRSPPSANSASRPQRTHLTEPKYGRQSWRSGYQSAPNFSQVTRGSRKSDDFATSDAPMLIRRDSDPCMGNERRSSVPVKCPPRCGRATATSNHTGTMTVASPPDVDDSNYLMRLYDTRTWEMYRRITEARKNSDYSYTRNTANAKLDHNTAGENTSEWENLQHDYPDSEGGHDMIFLFDFD